MSLWRTMQMPELWCGFSEPGRFCGKLVALMICFPGVIGGLWGTETNGVPTFNKDVAPLIFKHCAPCHRPGQTAPFYLTTYDEVRKRSQLVEQLTRERYMPPWLPGDSDYVFANDRRLSDAEIAMIGRWVKGGMPEGNPVDLPEPPKWVDDWQLGKPDAIVDFPKPYLLKPDGRDVYRNFVIPIPFKGKRYIKGIEFHPGNSRVIHHAFINTDASRLSRRMASGDPPGIDGMTLPETANMPEGQLLSWQPGRPASFAARGLAWTLQPDCDLVIQLHMSPSGKPEAVSPRIGFYFADSPGTNLPFRLNLSQLNIDIPPGAKSHVVRNEFTLPVDVELIGALPHLHYLGREVRGTAVFPDGTVRRLLHIPRWNFNWQSDYQYRDPILLPRGTTLKMEFAYDNSADNPANPNQPPKRVVYGSQTADEMAELWLQVMPLSNADRVKLGNTFVMKLTQDSLEYNRGVIAKNPRDSISRTRVAKALVVLGKDEEALEHLKAALQADPKNDKAYYEVGAILMRQKRLEPAEKTFRAVLRFNPNDYQAFGSLGIVLMRQGRLDEAELAFLSALEIHPSDEIAFKNLEVVRKARSGGAQPVVK